MIIMRLSKFKDRTPAFNMIIQRLGTTNYDKLFIVLNENNGSGIADKHVPYDSDVRGGRQRDSAVFYSLANWLCSDIDFFFNFWDKEVGFQKGCIYSFR